MYIVSKKGKHTGTSHDVRQLCLGTKIEVAGHALAHRGAVLTGGHYWPAQQSCKRISLRMIGKCEERKSPGIQDRKAK